MKLLLTSVGISNGSIRAALVDLHGKPTAACKAICVPTAIYALPGGNADSWLMLRELANIGLSMCPEGWHGSLARNPSGSNETVRRSVPDLRQHA